MTMAEREKYIAKLEQFSTRPKLIHYTSDVKKMVSLLREMHDDIKAFSARASTDDLVLVGYMNPKDNDVMPLDIAKDCVGEDGFAFTVPIYKKRQKRG